LAIVNPLRYASGYYDAATGRYLFGARYYDPTTGRFSQPDPSGESLNSFSYAGDDPIDQADPSGDFNTNCGNISCTGYFSRKETAHINHNIQTKIAQYGIFAAETDFCGLIVAATSLTVVGAAVVGVACALTGAVLAIQIFPLINKAAKNKECFAIKTYGLVEATNDKYCHNT
jgi:RHS repeat-associated protein